MRNLIVLIFFALLTSQANADVRADNKTHGRDSNDNLCGVVLRLLNEQPGSTEYAHVKVYLVTDPAFKYTKKTATRELFIEGENHYWMDIYANNASDAPFFNRIVDQVQGNIQASITKAGDLSVNDPKFCLGFERNTAKVLRSEILPMGLEASVLQQKFEDTAKGPIAQAPAVPSSPQKTPASAAAAAPAAKPLAAPAAVPGH